MTFFMLAVGCSPEFDFGQPEVSVLGVAGSR